MLAGVLLCLNVVDGLEDIDFMEKVQAFFAMRVHRMKFLKAYRVLAVPTSN